MAAILLLHSHSCVVEGRRGRAEAEGETPLEMKGPYTVTLYGISTLISGLKKGSLNIGTVR